MPLFQSGHRDIVPVPGWSDGDTILVGCVVVVLEHDVETIRRERPGHLTERIENHGIVAIVGRGEGAIDGSAPSLFVIEDLALDGLRFAPYGGCRF